MGFLKGLFTGGRGYAAAQNAAAAEYIFNKISIIDKININSKIIDIFRSGMNSNLSEDQIAKKFDNLDRITQLNFIAIAVAEIGEWDFMNLPKPMEVRNPFRDAALVDKSDIIVAQKTIQRTTGEDIKIKNAPLKFEEDFGI